MGEGSYHCCSNKLICVAGFYLELPFEVDYGRGGGGNILRPNLSSQIHHKQSQQKDCHDQETKDRSFNIDDQVFVRNFAATGPTWLPGTIIEAKGPVTFHIELTDGRVFRRHIDHIRKRTCIASNTDEPEDDFLQASTLPSQAIRMLNNDTNNASISTEQFRRSTRIYSSIVCVCVCLLLKYWKNTTPSLAYIGFIR